MRAGVGAQEKWIAGPDKARPTYVGRTLVGPPTQLIEQDPGPRGSPHDPHAPVDAGNGAGSPFPALVLTAKTDSSFCRFAPSHDGQLGDWPSRVRYSNCWPQPRHSYSKSGMTSIFSQLSHDPTIHNCASSVQLRVASTGRRGPSRFRS